MNPVGAVRRALSMDRREAAFRLGVEGRKTLDRVRVKVARPRWRRAAFRAILGPPGATETPDLARCRAAARRGDWMEAHRAFAAHVAARRGAFPVIPAVLPELAAHVTERFPSAAAEAAAAADRIVAGSYDLLGYRGLHFGAPPRWHFDPAHGRTAPSGFWATVPYLDPASGDHKVIWELNRHQHFAALGRAYYLAGQPRYYREFVGQLASWRDANPPLDGMNWASMLELAFRSLSWLWALHFFAPAVAADDGGAPWTIDLVVALDRQLAHVRHNLSRYFSPNTHLTGEALALYVAGLALPELRSSRSNTATGGDVLVAEATRQVRGDGGHAELSAHYHRYSTDFYLLATSVAHAAGDARELPLRDSAGRQAHYLRIVADDDGCLPLIGDDDGGQLFPLCARPPADCRDTLATAAVLLDRPDLQIGPTPEETYWWCGSRVPVERLDRPAAAAMPPASTALTESGYYVVRSRGDHLVFDAGPHGYLNGGHAHADALSLVLTRGGVPLLVDPGTATYTMEPGMRDLFRSTAMHNTVVVNGVPQSRPRGPFHWDSRAAARAAIWRNEPGFTYVEGRHDGYAPTIHTRGVLAVPGFGWVVIDHLIGSGAARADAHWHLHPDWAVVSTAGGALTLQHRSGRQCTIAASAPLQKLPAEEAGGLDLYAPVYGRVERACTLRMRAEGLLPLSFATFIPAVALDVRVEEVAVAARPPAGWHAAAFRLSSGSAVSELLCSVEIDGRMPAPGASPESSWGTEATTTDARLALRGAASLVVNGGHVASRVADSGLAPAVHQSSPGRYGRG